MKSKMYQMLHTSYGRLVISILLGLGLASLFKKRVNLNHAINLFHPMYLK